MNWVIDSIRSYRDRPGEADVFGVILYTEAHPHIIKLLNDDVYWKALSELSGPRWAVFAIRASQGTLVSPRVLDGSFGFLVPVWKEPTENEELLDFFEIGSSKNLPLLLIFTMGHDGEVLKNEIKLNDFSVEVAFDSIKDALVLVADSLQKIDNDNLKNTYGVYAALSLAVTHHRDWKRVRAGTRIWQWLKSIGI